MHIVLALLTTFLVTGPLLTFFHEYAHTLPALIWTSGPVQVMIGSGEEVLFSIPMGRAQIFIFSFLDPWASSSRWGEIPRALELCALALGPVMSLLLAAAIFNMIGDTFQKRYLRTLAIASFLWATVQFSVTALPLNYPEWMNVSGGISDGAKFVQLLAAVRKK